MNLDDLNLLFLEWREKQRQERIQETGISGYCSCCGAPNFVDKDQIHDVECIWYENH